MGRKALEKDRKPLSPKAQIWVRELFPKLQNRSLEKLTLDDIASLINKSKSTIYTYFTTKEEIFDTTVIIILNDLEGAVLKEFPEDRSVKDLYAEVLIQISTGISGMSIQFVEEIKLYYPTVWQTIRSFIDRLIGSFRKLYERGMETGEFKSYNIELLMAMDYHFVLSIMTDSQQFKDLSLNDLVTQYLDLRIRALCN
ncbi:MAG: TetR/AcrR family transcriptional regulator [bacterium]|nr:TetR/AcrR family transcriptional regulator [bacterium]